ncbi:hypothetical protein P4S68_13635 [Pseudoalteromonas sp. Hal099]
MHRGHEAACLGAVFLAGLLYLLSGYTTAAVTSFHYGSSDATSKAFNDGADWVGILFAAYNGFAAIAAMCIPFLVKNWVKRRALL